MASFHVTLNPYDCSLSLIVSSGNPCLATARTNDGFGYMCHGARATLAIHGGKYYLRARMGKVLDVNVAPEHDILTTSYYARVGLSHYHTAVDELGEVRGSAQCCEGVD